MGWDDPEQGLCQRPSGRVTTETPWLSIDRRLTAIELGLAHDKHASGQRRVLVMDKCPQRERACHCWRHGAGACRKAAPLVILCKSPALQLLYAPGVSGNTNAPAIMIGA